jgi:hypothetical protein
LEERLIVDTTAIVIKRVSSLGCGAAVREIGDNCTNWRGNYRVGTTARLKIDAV